MRRTQDEALTFDQWAAKREIGSFSKVTTQVSGSVNSEEKILKPNDYPGNLDYPAGDWKTIFRKSESLICGF